MQQADPGLRLAELIMALSLATDLGMGQPMEWALRSCVLGVRFGETLGLGDADLSDVYYLALLAFVGCTSDAHETAKHFNEIALNAGARAIDLGKPTQVMGLIVRHAGEGKPPLQRVRSIVSALAAGQRESEETFRAHCEVAQRLAGRLGFGRQLQGALVQLFERWDGKGLPNGLKGEELALPVRVAQIALCAETFHRLGSVDEAMTVVRQRAGGEFDPEIARRFCAAAPQLLTLPRDESIWEAALDAEPGRRPYLSDDQLDNAARAMADFTDIKSPYTVGHSSGVAELAAQAARQCGLPEADVVALRRAGFLHDLGRVGVSSRIWDKEGPLTQGEWERVRLHPYYTERILARPKALAQLGALAALHHERLDGSGYHRGLPAALQPVSARILAAADAYHAMTEPRPHRPALSAEAAAGELQREVRAGRLDGEAVSAVLAAAGHPVRAKRHEWPAGLSERQVEVLRLIARGHSIQEIAAILTVSKKTADNHIQHIYNKIGVSTRAAATLFAMQHDLVRDIEQAETQR